LKCAELFFDHNNSPVLIFIAYNFAIVSTTIKVSLLLAKNNIGFITINPNSKNREKIGEGLKDMRKFSKKYDHDDFLYTVDKGSELATAFGASKTPHIYLFDSNGKLVYKGAIDDNARKPKKVKKSYLMDALNALGSGKSIKVAETKALGCSIKFANK